MHTVDQILLMLSLTLMAATGYLAWPSVRNVIAHTQLAFALFAYCIPIFVLDEAARWNASDVSLYVRISVLGAFFLALGTLVGKNFYRRPTRSTSWQYRHEGMDAAAIAIFGRYLGRIFIVSLLVLLLSVIIMGFVPALAEDPLSAKFFRGAYGDRYRPVAPFVRVSTVTIAALLPLIWVYAWQYRSRFFVILGLAGVLSMLLMLQREPAAVGTLMAVGVVLVHKVRFGGWILAVVLASSYTVGTLFYKFAGIDQFAAGSSVSIAESIYAGAPDLRDHLHFMNDWVNGPEWTLGRTFYGGLVPSHYEWNTSVWVLKIVAPGSSVDTIVSGGFRLPVAIWGYVSFGFLGIISVAFISGLALGVLTRRLALSSTQDSVIHATIGIVVYEAFVGVYVEFYTLHYMDVTRMLMVGGLVGLIKLSISKSQSDREKVLLENANKLPY